ncbi:hypothetical protein T484DRAFT_1609664 [Baffinella frigidus]|nr:hypothetical protein T484DRAFT_1609664 [Cryptophyta sp. CCMP2293]
MAAGAIKLGDIRTNWTEEEIAEIYNRPLIELIFDAGTVHRMYHNPREVQQATLLSIKTGGCIETCGYCSQSSSWSKDTKMVAEKLMDLDDVFKEAVRAHESGSTRFCMGAAWRGPSQVGPKQFDRVLDMVSKVRALGMEVCTTLGMLTAEQAAQLKVAGLSCYNHNVDTSRSYYEKITSSRTYEDRLDTISKVREAGISVCTGGIIGMGESDNDRIGLLYTLSTLAEHPESIPINALVPVEGTPMAKLNIKGPTGLEMVRCVATARVLMPKSMVRLSAGRMDLSIAEQAMCFLAGANSIFAGDKLLTTPNNERGEDAAMFTELGLVPMPAFKGIPDKSNPGRFEIPTIRAESIHKVI